MKLINRRWALTITGLFSCFVFVASANTLKYNQNNFRKAKEFNQKIDFENPDNNLLNIAIFFVTNEQRVANKLQALKHNIALENSAKMHAESMLSFNFMDHINKFEPDKRTPDQRATKNNISNPYIAENIARVFGMQYISGKKIYIHGHRLYSYQASNPKFIEPHSYLSFAENVVKGWMQSKGHRKNILSTDAIELGCYALLYFDKNFHDFPTFICVQNFQFFEPIVQH